MSSDCGPEPAGPSRAGFRAGAIASLPVLPAVAPFGLIFGTVAMEAGLDPVQALAMAALVIAGASQLAALQLLGEGAPFLVILATSAAVNLRMMLYSASLAAAWRGTGKGWRALAAFFLHDQAYGLSINRYRARPGERPAERIGFFFGTVATTCTVWMLATWAGIAVGEQLPEELGLEFFVPLAFLALVAPMIRSKPEIAAAATAVAVGVALKDLPYRSGIFVASGAGVAVGMACRRIGRPSEARS